MYPIEQTIEEQVKAFCAWIGKDPLLVQGAGGNVSWKDGDTLWVKASGTWLADATEKDIFVPVDLPYLRASIENGDFTVTPKVLGETGLRPSIETLLHALMPHRIAVHLHAIEILAHLVRNNCQTDLQSLIDESIHWAMVDYYKPGAALAAAVSVALTQSANVDVLFLKNHGVVIGGTNIEEIHSVLNQLITILSTQPNPIINSKEIAPIVLNGGQQYIPVDIPGIHDLTFKPNYFNRLNIDWALYPDHVVFLGPIPACYDSVKLLMVDLSNNNLPELIFLKEQGVFTKPGISSAKLAQLKCYYDLMVRQSNHTRLKSLNEQQIAELLNWDAEHFRQNIAKQ